MVAILGLFAGLTLSAQSTQRLSWVKPRVVVETDAPGGDPDDEASLVRFFLYLNEWDTEALIGTRGPGDSRLGISGKERILQYVDDYRAVYPNLRVHADGFPEPDRLRARVYQSYEGTEARDAVVSILEADDPRPIWYQDWGTNEDDGVPTALRQALDYLQVNRSPAVYRQLVAKLRYVEVHLRDFLGHHRLALRFYMDTFYPTMDGGRWYHRWKPLTEKAGGFDIERHVRATHGPLTANYTITKEGDTPVFMHLIPNGLHDPEHPEWGSWSGRYGYNAALNMWWCDQRDTWNGSTHRDNTLLRWVEHIQNDFRARAGWCVSDKLAGANHAPVPVLNGDRGWDVLLREAVLGEAVELTAAGSSDPDGDSLHYAWFHYREAGSYGGEVQLEGASTAVVRLRMPEDAHGHTIHVVLQVTDSGQPALTRYRRMILAGKRQEADAR
ncbi:MAG: DUF1593 domain-containing protein [Bryobacterales bacterium]|nr:DUF1593 domain-containing protein [Bryobacterales bacterium]